MSNAHIGTPSVGHEIRTDVNADYLFEGMIPRHGLAFLVGPPNVGKSLFIVWMATCLAIRRPLFGSDATQSRSTNLGFGAPFAPGAMLYITGEDEGIFPLRAKASFRWAQMTGDVTVQSLPDQRLPIICLPASDLSGDEAVIVEQKIENQRNDLEKAGFPIRVVVFDTLTSVFRINDENSNAEMQRLMRKLRGYGRRFDALVVVVGHPKKGRARNGLVRGAGSIDATADVILKIAGPARGKTIRRVSLEKIRHGVCAGASFEFEIGVFEGQAAVHPATKAVASSVLVSRYVELLLEFETWSPEYGALTENNGNKLVYGISLERMVNCKFDADHAGSTEMSRAHATRIKDRVRKQVGRDGLFKLVELGLCERYEDNGKLHFRPSLDWDTMSEKIAELDASTSYQSTATRQRNQINQLYADPERDGDAMPAPLFRALGQVAIRLRQFDNLRNRLS
jgi:hypothetical protein